MAVVRLKQISACATSIMVKCLDSRNSRTHAVRSGHIADGEVGAGRSTMSALGPDKYDTKLA